MQGTFLIFDEYTTFSDIKNKDGVVKKVNNQIKAFRNASITMSISCVGWRLYGKPLEKLIFFVRQTIKLPFINPKPSFLEDIQNYDFIYMRRPPYINPNFLRMLKKIKMEKPSIKIIMELPSYPYDKEISNLIHYPILLKDRLARRHLHKYVDRIATLNDDKEIFGIQTIKIKNGYDFASFPARIPTPPKSRVLTSVV